MPQFLPPYEDYRFLLEQFLSIDTAHSKIGLADFDMALMMEIIEQGGKFAKEVVAPLNQTGDEQGCVLSDGKVTTPNGFAQAYQEYVANGWNAMLGNPEYGGQGLPYSAAVPIHEMLNSACFSWRLTTMLTESAVLAVDKHANQQLKDLYLEKLISGEWTGTMNLTEPHAGSDLSLLKTKAEPQDDGSYQITGTKIFITGGDHDWTNNIIHMVLARLPDAPPGVKGISLFLVPRNLLDEQGAPAQANQLSVGSIEKKMGIKASPTCVMNFDGATGWLVGEANKGLACMFTMMNDARFQVGLQGLGAAEASFQGALSYARERLQSHSPYHSNGPQAIIEQPDVRRMLLTQKALVEGCRALAMVYAQQMDLEKYADPETAQQAEQVLAFLTPVCKGFMTDMATEVTNIGVQVFGGHGYIHEWGMEQLVRDTRIAQLYEGTNGIQAADLIGRKLTRDKGHMMRATAGYFAERIANFSHEQYQATANDIINEWQRNSESLLERNPTDIATIACDYLHYTAYQLLALLWLDMADKASGCSQASIRDGKRDTMQFYMSNILPRKHQHLSAMQADNQALAGFTDAAYDYKQ